jgi:hypothetical protein
MANPNIVNVTTIYGNTAVANVSTSATAIVTNNSSSGKIYKVNMLVVSNIDATNAANLTVDLFRSAVATQFISNISVAINTAYSPIDKTMSLYLLEGDSIRLTANANSRLQAVCSWEEIS